MHQPAEQDLPGDVEEQPTVARQRFETKDVERAMDGLRAGIVAVHVRERVERAVAKQQLVCHDLEVQIEDRLARYEEVVRGRRLGGIHWA